MRFDSDHAEIYSRGVSQIPKAYNRQGVIWEKNREEGYDIIVYDWDGTILTHWSAESFLKLTEMPILHTEWYGPNGETLDGGSLLIPDGYNWTLEQAQSFVSRYRYLDIGALYTAPCSYIWLEATGTGSWNSVGILNALIDYGDGNGIENPRQYSHTFQKGNYLIKIYGNSLAQFGRSATLGYNSTVLFSVLGRITSPVDLSSANLIFHKIYCGENSSIYRNAFYRVPSTAIGISRNTVKTNPRGFIMDATQLAHLTLPPSFNEIDYLTIPAGYGACENLLALKSVSLPYSWHGPFALSNIPALERIIFPFEENVEKSLLYFGWLRAHSNALKQVVIPRDFTPINPSSTNLKSANLFSNSAIAADMKIYVPVDATLQDFIANNIQNSSTYASYFTPIVPPV